MTTNFTPSQKTQVSWLSQTTFPRLWQFYQYWLGGTVAKRKLALRHYRGQRQVLEVGCSLGNIAHAFASVHDVQYTGLDIDSRAIDCAREIFRARKDFRFACRDISESNLEGEQYDYVLVPGVCHHLSGESCRKLVAAAGRVLHHDGVMVVDDMVLPNAGDGWLTHFYVRIDRGQWVRSDDDLRRILESIDDLELYHHEQHLIAALPWGWPRAMRFALYLLRQRR